MSPERDRGNQPGGGSLFDRHGRMPTWPGASPARNDVRATRFGRQGSPGAFEPLATFSGRNRGVERRTHCRDGECDQRKHSTTWPGHTEKVAKGRGVQRRASLATPSCREDSGYDRTLPIFHDPSLDPRRTSGGSGQGSTRGSGQGPTEGSRFDDSKPLFQSHLHPVRLWTLAPQLWPPFATPPTRLAADAARSGTCCAPPVAVWIFIFPSP